MAPKAASRTVATKRTRESISGTPAKKSKVDDRIQEAVAAVQAALQESDLPEDCRAMLVAFAPGSLCMVAAEREEAHLMAVRMIGETIFAQRKALEQAVSVAEAKLAEVEGSSTAREAKVSEAESSLADRTADVDEKSKVLAATSQAMLETKNCLEEAFKVKQVSDDALAEAASEKTSIEEGLSTNFKPLKEGTCEAGQATAHVAALIPLIKRVNLDESLASALPSSCTKKPSERGPFDKMVIDQLEILMGQRVTELVEILAAGEASTVELAAKVNAAQGSSDEAKESQRQAAASLQISKAAQRDASSLLEEAKASVTAFVIEQQEASTIASEKKAALESFVSVKVASFEMLRDKAAAVPSEEESSPDSKSETQSPAQVMTEKVRAAAAMVVTPLAIGGQ